MRLKEDTRVRLRADDPLRIITHAVIMASVIRSFADKGTEDIFDGESSRAARSCCPVELWAVAQRKMDMLNRVRLLVELTSPPGNRLERLKGDRADQYSIRINGQYRLCFRWEEGDAYEVEITDYR